MSQGPVLVAGKSGQVARCLSDMALRRNMAIMAMGRPEFDIEDEHRVDRVMAAVKPSAIINAAAYTAVDRAESEAELAFRINGRGAALLANAAARQGIPFVHISTDYVFGGRKHSPYLEDERPDPLSVYGASKLAGEVAVLKTYPDAIVLRTSWIYSSYGENFLRTMLRLSESQHAARIVNDQHGTPTSARDLAAGILTIVDQLCSSTGKHPSGIYHLAGDGETTRYGFAAATFASLAQRGRRIPGLRAITSAEYPTPARRPDYSALDSTKAERDFGVRLPAWQVSLEDCLDQIEMSRELHAC
jgi:dTDP-4-dehydrorhamnose reductase